jgi:hypothetical protein
VDIAQLTSAPRQVTLAGREYTIRPLKFREWGRLHNFVKDNADDPVTTALRQLAKARAKGIPVTELAEAALLGKAREEAQAWPPGIASSRWFAALSDCTGGAVEFLWILLTVFQPELTRDQAEAIEAAVTPEETSDLVRIAIGVEDPKAVAPEDRATGVRPTTKRSRKSRSETTGPRRSTS